jgi:hypothetical protein
MGNARYEKYKADRAKYKDIVVPSVLGMNNKNVGAERLAAREAEVKARSAKRLKQARWMKSAKRRKRLERMQRKWGRLSMRRFRKRERVAWKARRKANSPKAMWKRAREYEARLRISQIEQRLAERGRMRQR